MEGRVDLDPGVLGYKKYADIFIPAKGVMY